MVLVVDSSGSMKQADAGNNLTRMQAAQNAVASLTKTLDPATQVSLVTYGSRTPGDDVTKAVGCQDVTIEQSLGPLDQNTLNTKAKALKPGGWTPIAKALETAASQLNGQPGTIILVSDGKDTCTPPDPCDQAKKLKQLNPNLAISTVGFKTDADDQMNCIAQATGGNHVTADNAAQLNTRMSASVNVEQAATQLAPQGAQGLSVGDDHTQITKTNPDFPALTTGTKATLNGKNITWVIWKDCRWGFDGNTLYVIDPVSHKTIDQLGVGSTRAEVEAILGEPLSTNTGTNGTNRVYTADENKGLAWTVTYDQTGHVTLIVLCHCMPQEQASNVLTFDGIGPFKLGADAGPLVGSAVLRDPDVGCRPFNASEEWQRRGISLNMVDNNVDSNGPGVISEIYLEGAKTSDFAGARPGMTWGEIKRLHPDARVVTKEGNGGSFNVGEIRSNGRMIVFMADWEASKQWSDSTVIDQFDLMDYAPEIMGGC